MPAKKKLKPKYEPPVALNLGKFAMSHGAPCETGLSANGQCASGPAVSGGGSCISGGTANALCQSGTTYAYSQTETE